MPWNPGDLPDERASVWQRRRLARAHEARKVRTHRWASLDRERPQLGAERCGRHSIAPSGGAVALTSTWAVRALPRGGMRFRIAHRARLTQPDPPTFSISPASCARKARASAQPSRFWRSAPHCRLRRAASLRWPSCPAWTFTLAAANPAGVASRSYECQSQPARPFFPWHRAERLAGTIRLPHASAWPSSARRSSSEWVLLEPTAHHHDLRPSSPINR